MEYRMKDIMEPPKTLEEQKKEAREADTSRSRGAGRRMEAGNTGKREKTG